MFDPFTQLSPLQVFAKRLGVSINDEEVYSADRFREILLEEVRRVIARNILANEHFQLKASMPFCEWGYDQ